MQDWMQQAVADAAEAAPTTVRALPPVVPGRTMHLDADLLCYWAGGNEETTVEESRLRAAGRIETMRELTGAESVVLHLTDDGSTKGDRRIIAVTKPYQGNRSSGRRPKNWGYLREWCQTQTTYRTKVWASREADDGMALCAYHELAKHGRPVVIASGDKDMRMLPGVHIDWQDFSITEVPLGTWELVGSNGKVYGLKWFFLQMLQGDTADNIPGLPKFNGKPVGPKTAEGLLAQAKNPEEGWLVLRTCYAATYPEDWRERLVEQAMLLWLRTDADAWCGDFWRRTGAAGLRATIDIFQQRIKDAYAQAESLGGSGVPSDRA